MQEVIPSKRSLKNRKKAKYKKKKVEETTYNIDNIISTGITKPVLMSLERKPIIGIPEFKVIDKNFYNGELMVCSLDNDQDVEDDLDERYNEMHKGHELAEIYNKFSRTGEVLPESIKDGLKIRIRLPKDKESLPSLIY